MGIITPMECVKRWCLNCRNGIELSNLVGPCRNLWAVVCRPRPITGLRIFIR